MLITDLALILIIAGITTLICKKLKQPVIIGYVLAGFLLSPVAEFFPMVVGNAEEIETLAEIGVIFLMFSLGLEFNLHKMAQVGVSGTLSAAVQIVGMVLLGYLVGMLLGWSATDSLFLGGMLSMSSTIITVKAIEDCNMREKKFASLAIGTLIIEDIAAIFLMMVLSTVSVSRGGGADLVFTIAKLLFYLAFWLLLGIFLVPTIIQKIRRLLTGETLLIVALALCFGMVLIADALGFSSALGAFLAGSLLAGTVHAERVEHLTAGVKDLFGAVFFISVGMMLNPGAVVKYAVPILILTLVTIVGKLIFSSLGVLLSGHTLRQAIHCGCALAQIGEFAFIIASLGLSLGVIADYIYPIIISVSVITTLTTPFFIKSADSICNGIEKLLPEKLVQKLDSYTDAEQTAKEQDSDWAVFLRRYIKRTVFYGVLMLGIVSLGDMLLLPLLEKTLSAAAWVSKAVTLCAVYLCIAMFVRPMLDAHSPQYTVLWAKKRSFRLPLIALSVIRVLLIVFIVFLPIRSVLGIHSLWILPLLAAAVLVAGHFGWFASAYLLVETRFLTNFNERLLQQYGDSNDATWLDEKMYVTELICPPEEAGKDLRALGWGRRYGANIIKIVRGKKEFDIPSGDMVLSEGDRLAVIGEKENLVSLRLSIGADAAEDIPTLHTYIAGEKALYTYTLDVAKNDHLAGSTIRDSGLRENYDCMILGLQRNLLPIIGPDVNFVIQRGDLVWLLGSHRMAEKALDDMEEA